MRSSYLMFPILPLVFIVLGIPLVLKFVPPNRLYGWRSEAALRDPRIWYPVNQVTGLWTILAGLLLAGAAMWTRLAGFADFPLVCIGGAAVFLGIIGMGIHGGITERRLKDTDSGANEDE